MRFAVFPMPASNSIPQLIDNIVEEISAITERRPDHEWVSPGSKSSRRSEYGKGVYPPDLDLADRTRPKSSEISVDAACTAFPKRVCDDSVLHAVCDRLAKQVPPPESDAEVEEGDDEKADESKDEDNRGALQAVG